jgi:hypothetical protein
MRSCGCLTVTSETSRISAAFHPATAFVVIPGEPTKRSERAERDQLEAHKTGLADGNFSSISWAAAGSVTFKMNTTPLPFCCAYHWSILPSR